MEGGEFDLVVWKGNRFLQTLVTDMTGKTEGTSIVSHGPGEYRLEIHAPGTRWTVVAEERK